MKEKLTNRDKYELLKEALIEIDDDNIDILIDFLEEKIALIDKKRDSDKAKAIRKKNEGDELRSIVKSVLTKDYQMIDEIFEKVKQQVNDDEEITKAKIIARLAQLIKMGIAEKAGLKVENSKTRLKGYRLLI